MAKLENKNKNDVVTYYEKVLELVRAMKKAGKFDDDTINQFVMQLQKEITIAQPTFDLMVGRMNENISNYGTK